MGFREYRRTPVLLVLLVAAPVYVIGLFSVVVPSGQIPLHLASDTTVTASLKGFIGALMAPVAGAFIGGLTGLFVMQTTRETDGRLVLAGYRPYQVGLARLLLLGSVGVLVTVISMVMLLLTGFTPALLGWFALATLSVTLVYAMVGVLVGTVLDTLSGVYFLLFVPMFDLFLFQNPLASDPPSFATYLPGNFPLRLAMDAAFTGNVDVTALGGSLAVLVILTVLATAAFYRSLRETG
jgi:ABC-2 type transport system permease protein